MKKLCSLVLAVVALSINASGAVVGQKFSKRAVTEPLKVAQATASRLTVAVEEDFSKFSAGSEDNPAAEPLETDWWGSFDESKVTVKGWGGNGVYEAGGCAFLKAESVMWSPTIDMSDAVNKDIVISFRARLGAGAESGEPSVRMGYGEPFVLPALTAEWKDYKLDIPSAYSGADFTFAASADWLIDDIKIEKHTAYIETPGGLSFNNYTVTGFRAVWQPVDGAHHYLVDVSSVDETLQVLTPVLSGLETSETFYDVIGLPEIDDLFCFSVKAVDAKGNLSESSTPLLVEALLTPQTFDATDVTENGFTATWSPVDGAICYDFYVYRQNVADVEEDFAIVDTDFSFITAETNSEEYTVSFDMLPGWIVNVPMFEEGALGMDGAKAPLETTLFASMESPAYNLSAAGGEIEITVSARSTRGAKVTFSLFTMKNGAYPVYPESYVALEGLPFEEYETRTFTLTGGGESSVIYIETADWGQVWLSDLKIVQHVKAGETVSAPVVNYITVDSSAEVRDVTLTDGYRYYYTLRAVGISRDEEYYISSDFTAPHYVAYESAGVEDISLSTSPAVSVSGSEIIVSNAVGSAVKVFDLAGSLIADIPVSEERQSISVGRGVYIVSVGSHTFKVLL